MNALHAACVPAIYQKQSYSKHVGVVPLMKFAKLSAYIFFFDRPRRTVLYHG